MTQRNLDQGPDLGGSPEGRNNLNPSRPLNALASRSNLTHAQLLLWVGQQLDPATPLYNMAMAMTIKGPLAVDSLRRAIEQVVERSDALRTVFEERDGFPHRSVLAQVPLEFLQLDFSARSDPRTAALDWCRHRCAVRFELDRRLFDTAVLRLADDCHVWYFNHHHLITDAWSFSLIYREVQRHYLHLRDPHRNSTPDRLPDFESYAAFERKQRHANQAVDYWQQKLTRSVVPPRLYGRREADHSTRTERVTFDLGEERSALLRAMATRSEARTISAHLSLFNIFSTLLFAHLPSPAEALQSASGNSAAAVSGPTFDDLAYVIYTSGSTGRPKGVPISHRNLAHSTIARHRIYPIPVDRFLLLSSFAFDSSVAGIFWTLTVGGTLVLPPPQLEQDIAALLELIQSHGITHVLCLPSLYAIILEQAAPKHLASLRTVIVAGEACPPAVVREHFARAGSVELYNEYGPTEATVWSTVHRVAANDAAGPEPVGRPIPNMAAVVLDWLGQPVPSGVVGELFLAGKGLAQGYLNRPDLDRGRFVARVIGDLPHTRWYRTGDLAAASADGTLMFLGRVDRQVKIRGYRIELEEIEEVLRAHPAVTEAAVVVGQSMPTPNPDGATPAASPNGDPHTLAARLAQFDDAIALRLLAELDSLTAEEVQIQLSETAR